MLPRCLSSAVVLGAVLLCGPAGAGEPSDRTFTSLGGGGFGDSGGLGSRGTLQLQVPMVLPTPRGDVPLPFAVVYTGGPSIGAAGVGWEVPIAGVVRQRNISRRKPVHPLGPAGAPRTADRILLDLGAGTMLMSRTESPGVYQPFGRGYFRLAETPVGFTGTDGSGRVWIFERLAGLFADEVFPLTRVVDVTGRNRVDLHYDIYDRFTSRPVEPPYPPDHLSMRELVLREIAHSHGADGACPKYRIRLEYWNGRPLRYPVPYPGLRGVEFQAGHPRARTKLLRTVRVHTQSTTACVATDEKVERSYRLEYDDDALTGQPRLARVDMYVGGDDAPKLPVVGYRYGTVASGGRIRYTPAEILTLPTGPAETAGGFGLSYAEPILYGLFRHFADLNGDGRPDYLTLTATTRRPEWWVNRPAPDWDATILAPAAWTTAQTGPYMVGTADLATNMPIVVPIENTWQEVIDFNGDGRADILVASAGKNLAGQPDPNFWMLLVNTPGPSGRPDDIRWLERHIDITDLRDEIRHFHRLSVIANSDQASKRLPLSRTHNVGAHDAQRTVESSTLTQWKLLDVNGDGFPDFVFDRFGVLARAEQVCDEQGSCRPGIRQDHPNGNQIMVIYHTGPMMAGSGAGDQARWRGPAVTLRDDGACGIERLRAFADGRRRLECGFMEVNGDGIADYVIRTSTGMLAIQSPGLAEELDRALPENQSPADYGAHERKRSIALPGPPLLSADPRPQVCARPVEGSTLYSIEQQAGLRDITGDGIADYVYYGPRGALADGTALAHPDLTEADRTGPSGWWIMPGTGAGFAAPLAIEAPAEVPFALRVTRERCDGRFSQTLASLEDLDGDGRLEIVRAIALTRIRVAKLLDAAGNPGAHGAGQVVAVDNRYGGVTEIRYGSAKSDWRTKQNLPGPQIVVTSVESKAERGIATPLAPVRYAYGGAEPIYHPLLGRWVFPGYARRVTLRGEPVEGRTDVLRGTAVIEHTTAATESTGGLQRLLRTGLVRDVDLVAGTLPSDPRAMLVDGAAPRRAGRHAEFAVKEMPGRVPPLAPMEEECYETPRAEAPGQFGDLVLCRRSATVYVKSRTTWEGQAPPPSTASMSSRRDVLQVDAYARPVLVKNLGDLATTEDDTCLDISYARPVPRGAPRLAATHTVRVRDCENRSRVWAGMRTRYDGLPEGLVRNGLPTSSVIERYDVSQGVRIGEIVGATLERDAFGSIVATTQTRADGAARRTATKYDPFGLESIRLETTATGLASPMVVTIGRDPHSLLPVEVLSPQGGAAHTTYDAFARTVRRSLSKPGDAQRYVVAEQQYTGFSDGETAPRMITTRLFHDWTREEMAGTPPAGSVTEEKTLIDDFGRVVHGVVELGADYGNRSMVVESTLYDALGRPQFVADPFPGQQMGQYGTTFFYRDDGRLLCMVEGPGVQTDMTPDESVDKYPHCLRYSYEQNRLVVRRQGPNELSAGKPQSGAYDERTYGATGLVRTSSRAVAGVRIEHMAFAYDRLSQLSRITRWQRPSALQGPVAWRFRRDSLGNVLTRSEPAVAEVRYRYGDWGELAEHGWTEGGRERRMRYHYDGLSRLTRMDEWLDGRRLEGSTRTYRYDQPGIPSAVLDRAGALGNLVEAEAGSTTLALGWDWLGRAQGMTHTDVATGEQTTQTTRIGPLGQMEQLAFLTGGEARETILYDYDSTRRLRAVRFRDASGTTPIWRVLSRDDWGRVVEARSGNGARERNEYKPEARREILSRTVEAAAGIRKVLFVGYDGILQLKGYTETTTLGGNGSVATLFTYDARNQLARVTRQRSSQPDREWAYGYDGLGNLVRREELVSGQSLHHTVDPQDPDRLCRAALLAPVPTRQPEPGPVPCTWRYDAMGNVARTGEGGVELAHDMAGRWVRGARGEDRVEAAYGPLGALGALRHRGAALTRREVHSGAETRVAFVDAQGQRLERIDGGLTFGGYTDRRIVSEEGILATVRRTDRGARILLYPEGDHQGARLVLDQDGGVLETIEYSPFGAVMSDSRPENSLFRLAEQWNGGEALAALGLTRLGQRLLDGTAGRFLERDPHMSTGTALGAHPYAFAWNNPAKWTDPSGTEPEDGDTGSVTSGLAAVGALLSPNASEAGAAPFPHVHWKLCGRHHDCLGILEEAGALTLTRWEQSLRGEDYYLVEDLRTRTILGALGNMSNRKLIYDREGEVLGEWGPGEDARPLEPSLFSPVDLLAGGLAGAVGKAFLKHGTRKAVSTVATAQADDAMRARLSKQPYSGLPPITEPLEWRIPHQGMSRLSGPHYGVTDPAGNIFINESILGDLHLYRYTLRHELCHRCLTAIGGGRLNRLRQAASQYFYARSSLLHFVEETVAETYATRSLLRGLSFARFSLRDAQLSGWRAAAEGIGGIGGAFGAGAGLRALHDSW